MSRRRRDYEGQADEEYVLTLYVAGQSPRSVRAIESLKRICEESLQGRYRLEVVDLYQQPERALHDDVVAVPTLVRRLPEPIRRVIGDLSDTERVLVGLELREGPTHDGHSES